MGAEKAVRVLVVEDNPIDQEILRRQLKTTSFAENVLFLSDPRAALDLLQLNPEAAQFKSNLVLIFIDVHLPYMSGIDLLKIIRSLVGMENFPIVIMTASPSSEVISICKKMDVVLMEKPIHLPNFSSIMAQLFHQPPNFKRLTASGQLAFSLSPLFNQTATPTPPDKV